jgi:23S rRNA pseudouridine2605 synthase
MKQRHGDNSRGFNKKRTTTDRSEKEGIQGRFNKPKTDGQQKYDRPQKTTKPVQKEQPARAENIRLNRFVANSGVCSRREADTLITKGLITVNGNVVTEMGVQVKPTDDVRYDGKRLNPEAKVYILINKPKDIVTTSSDPDGRRTVLDLIHDACDERVYAVGRLDRNTTGVLMLTNDGDLSKQLTHPSSEVKKIYHVYTDKPVTKAHMEDIAKGLNLEDGFIKPDVVSYAHAEDRTQVGIEIHSGRNRIVRRIFEHLGYKVEKLDRVYFAGLTKKNLQRGKWRFLTQQEIKFLKAGILK